MGTARDHQSLEGVGWSGPNKQSRPCPRQIRGYDSGGLEETSLDSSGLGQL